MDASRLGIESVWLRWACRVEERVGSWEEGKSRASRVGGLAEGVVVTRPLMVVDAVSRLSMDVGSRAIDVIAHTSSSLPQAENL